MEEELILDNESVELLLEETKENEILHRIIVFYTHMIKYYYQPENRSSSWISSIFEQHRYLYDCYINNKGSKGKGSYSSISKSLSIYNYRDCFEKAKVVASSETKINKKYFDKYPFHNNEIDFFNIKNITDNNYLYNFLIDLSYDEETTRLLNLYRYKDKR